MKERRSRSAALVTLGSATTSMSKWLLVWLFAHSSGGPEAVGTYSYVLAFATPLFVLCQIGLRTIFLSSIIRWPWRTYSLLRVLGNVVGATVLIVFVMLSARVSLALGLSVAALKVCDSFLDLRLARMQYGNRMTRLGAIVTVSGVTTMVAAAILVLITGDGTVGVLTAALVSAGSGVWAHIEGRTVGYAPNAPGSGAGRILSASVPVMTSQFLATLLFQLPVLVLSAVSDPGTVGQFAGAAYLLTAASLAGSTLQTLLITPLRRTRENDGPAALRSRSSRIAVRAVLCAVPVGVAVVVVGSPALTLIYGPGFQMGQLPLALLAIGAIATIGAYIMSVSLTVLNRYISVTMAMGLSCGAALAAGGALVLAQLDPLLIGTTMSAVGATSRLLLMGWFVTRSARAGQASPENE